MKKFLSNLFQDPLDLTGFILIAVSTALFFFSAQFSQQKDTHIFFINYVFSVGYFLTILIHTFSRYRWHLSSGKITHTVLLLILWFISAFSLNREMNVFDSSTNWLSVWVVLSVVALLFASRSSLLPKTINYISYFLLGTALLLFTYYAIYLIPLYPVSLIGLLAIGVSMHTYIPLLLTIVTIVLIIRASRENKKLLYLSISGFGLPVLVCAWFLAGWNSTNNTINGIINQNTLNENKLPAWVYVSQQIDKSFLSERILKSGLVYRQASVEDMFFRGIPSANFDEQKQHDPLVIMGTLLFDKPNLDEKERVNILKSMYNARHQAQDRLWSGDHLETISVISNVKLFPEYRMAYTEKTLTVRNHASSRWSNQEAIYTFHLSEGSAVSSLSLWINGIEEKSRLTTKGKADTAYHEIVGVESRDPSVVHWQEGNTITVRVFPCTTDENRKFRIGITSPLSKHGNQLVYENAFFNGPAATNALETVQITQTGNAQDLQLPAGFRQTDMGIYQTDRTYEPDWKISFKAPQLAAAVFSFDGTAYQVNDYKEKLETFISESIYLDLNSSWTEAEFNQIWSHSKSKSVYVIDNTVIKLTDSNSAEIYNRMSKQNFSLFPISAIKNPEKALIISKSTAHSPNLNELEGSVFAKELTAYCKTPKHIRFYNIGYPLSPYLKALKEFRVLNYTQGNVAKLKQLLNKHQFIKSQENEETVVIDNAALMIHKVANTAASNAPNHLLRLFAYNNIMKKVSANYFNHDYIQPDIIAEADKAYIVSPVSSLIVLETQKDYERFGIENSKNSLQNASMKSSGAVPEPHEWMLIILGLCVIAYTLFSKKLNLSSQKD